MDDMQWPDAGGGTAAPIRMRDWRGTPLGPVSGWPERLRGLVDALRESPVPAALPWGPDRILPYNDGYAAVCGNPSGAVVWP